MFRFANVNLFDAVTDIDREFSEQDMNVEPKETVTSQVAATAHASISASTDRNSVGKKVKRIRKSRKRAV